MDPLVGAALVTGAAKLGGAVVGSRSEGRAIDAQERGRREQLQYEREIEAQRRREHEQEMAMRQAAWDAYQAQRAPFRRAAASVLAKYGDFGPYGTESAAPPPGWEPGASTGPSAGISPLGIAQKIGPKIPATPALQAPVAVTPEAFTFGGLIR